MSPFARYPSPTNTRNAEVLRASYLDPATPTLPSSETLRLQDTQILWILRFSDPLWKRKNLIGEGISAAVATSPAYHTYHTYLPYLPYGIYRMMPSPTDSPNVVESHMVSMYGKYVSI